MTCAFVFNNIIWIHVMRVHTFHRPFQTIGPFRGIRLREGGILCLHLSFHVVSDACIRKSHLNYPPGGTWRREKTDETKYVARKTRRKREMRARRRRRRKRRISRRRSYFQDQTEVSKVTPRRLSVGSFPYRIEPFSANIFPIR